MQFIEDPALLSMKIETLRLDIFTAMAPHSGTFDRVYCNVVFSDGAILYEPKNFVITPVTGPFPFGMELTFVPGNTEPIDLTVPDAEQFDRTIGEIAEFYLRKSGDDGWLLGSALLFANDLPDPVLGNSQINEFLDDGRSVLFRRDWSTRTFRSTSAVKPEWPILAPQHQVSGPVLGQLSDTSANILYRVDQEGTYRLRVRNAQSGQTVFDTPKVLAPTARFAPASLTPNTHYEFELYRVFDGKDVLVPNSDGEFRTFPGEDSGVRFSFAFGSCSGHKHNVSQTGWTGIENLAVDPSIDPVQESAEGVRFFVHLGDTFYFYDNVLEEEPANIRTLRAAHLSQRRHPGFLRMARVVPSCAVWDDHDFRYNNTDSVNFPLKDDAVSTFLEYWGNEPIDVTEFGLTSLITYGNVDVYLMDGRFNRDDKQDVCFSKAQLDEIFSMIVNRGRAVDRLVVLASGSTWNHTNTSGEAYGGAYDTEREQFYTKLASIVGSEIKGLVFLSGDIHQHEIYEIVLSFGAVDVLAPEFVSSPFGDNSSLDDSAQTITGERKVSFPSEGGSQRRGFATLDIDTLSDQPAEWRVTVNFHWSNAAIREPYFSKDYVLNDNGQFVFEP